MAFVINLGSEDFYPTYQIALFIFILARKFCKPADFSQYDLFQKVHTDVMSGGASAPIAFVVGTIKILDIRVALIEVVIQIVSAVDTDKQTGEHIDFSLIRFPLTDFTPLLLCFFPFNGQDYPPAFRAYYKPHLLKIACFFYLHLFSNFGDAGGIANLS
ncbi:protein of unknown function [Ruminococcaceae bacterium BL-4]|nr:protein of unknown function [Ruminococcaceae bacterium BL-4]